MDKKEAREHLTFIKRAIVELGYGCGAELARIKERYKNNEFKTNKELYDATSKMMCNERHRIYG